ncbi:hypothetical protein ACN27J_29930 [Solwaraspora sp. WMMB762]|uniref:hypothetical protein n=1 Tax=Solwaraspora sp. WMMB762 TaxID=3404120 RepID=UPI003B94669D
MADIHNRHASVEAYQVALANRAGGRLHRARIALGVSLALLIAGALVHLVGPGRPGVAGDARPPPPQDA